MRNILITGSTGYIGSFLTSYLKKKNYNILGVDIGFFRNCYLYKDKKKQETIYKDVRNITESDLKNIDVIVHLAGISNDPLNTLSSKIVYDPTRKYTFELAQKAKKLGIKFIFASSCSVYGATNNKLLLNENSHTNPQTEYSLNKLQIEKDLKKIADKNFFPICLRFATIFGVSKRIRFDVVINMLPLGLKLSFLKRRRSGLGPSILPVSFNTRSPGVGCGPGFRARSPAPRPRTWW